MLTAPKGLGTVCEQRSSAPNTVPQTCLLARTHPCSHAADHTLSVLICSVGTLAIPTVGCGALLDS